MLHIYSKPSCTYCYKAKHLLGTNSIPYKESIVGIHIMRESFMEAFPTAKTMPFIVDEQIDGFSQIIGGYDQLVEYLKMTGNPDDGELLQG